jgi:hypothetical protein
MRDRVYKGDTAIIEANLFDQDGVSTLPTQNVAWQVRKPDGIVVSGGPTNLERSEASIAFTDTTEPGAYSSQVTFTLTDGSKRSTVLSFEVVDPLETTSQSTNDVDAVVDRAWMKLEDLFDSELGGPHLRDRTLQNFDREKMKRMLPDALYNINNYFTPATGFDDATFPYLAHSPLLAQGILVEALYHLMRSYVEQPTPVGSGTPTYFDRRDYMQRWQTVLQLEEKRLDMWLDLFKKDQMGFGQSSLLVGGYASYSTRYPRYMRGKYPYVFRY